ncbi:MAG: 3-oxoacid CoA-transferase subunit B [Anaeromusa sp.]|uniref:3-oxoacid CoA-transferase subunit B n=1 Tax=Anaeromusa sp. TaxID=1872520 RepID=UPI002B21A211|nr:3-oxoacid CoA-transferase subunit B [Anaeromusa sp.]MEA4834595.1 3-oxoacid CoA-transferase subunit B [Anaeromusa sp.]
MDAKTRIARRVALEMTDGDVVNLGIGLPTQVVHYLPSGVEVMVQSENGFVGLGAVGKQDANLVDAGGQPAGLVPGAAMFDSAMSFALIRGGHIDVTVLGGLEVDQEGNLANWMVPGQRVPGMGGAMDLVNGARKVIVAMEHCTKKGQSKILRQCTLPLTGRQVVDVLVTELAVFSWGAEGMVLQELASEVTVADVRDKTLAEFSVSPNLQTMKGVTV